MRCINSWTDAVFAPRAGVPALAVGLGLGLLLPATTGRAQSTYDSPFTFSTWAGHPSPAGSVDAAGAAARFTTLSGAAVDSAGNLYVADAASNTIRKVTPAGVVSTWAGTAGAYGLVDGTGAAATFANPTVVACDTADNLYVGDSGSFVIRRIAPSRVVTTVAGTPWVSGNVDATGSTARFNNFTTMVALGTDIYWADAHRIRKMTAAGVVTTFAGSATAGNADGTGTAATFMTPNGLGTDGANLYVADFSQHTIRKVTPAGVVTTIAGTAGVRGSADGTGAAARFYAPSAVTGIADGTLYVADRNNQTIRQITPAGVVTTLAGTLGLPGSADGTGAAASFASPAILVADPSGNLLLPETASHSIRRISPAAVVTTLAGPGGSIGTVDGTAANARFNSPAGVALDAAGNVYVADASAHTVRKITAAGTVSTLAGLPMISGGIDGTGTGARFSTPLGLAANAAGTVYVADSANDTIRKVAATGVVTTLAGSTVSVGSTDATGSAARFSTPTGLALDSSGNLYVCDFGNYTLRRVTPAGVVTTLAGAAGSQGAVDGTGGAARFMGPYAVGIDGSGNLYVGDQSTAAGCSTIRKVTPAGVVTTVAGSATSSGYLDATGTAARFGLVTGVGCDAAGLVYLSDSGNALVRRMTPGGVVTTLAGIQPNAPLADGVGSAAAFGGRRNWRSTVPAGFSWRTARTTSFASGFPPYRRSPAR